MSKPLLPEGSKMNKAKIVIIIPSKGWCFENKAKAVSERLKNEFEITISCANEKRAEIKEADMLWVFHILGLRKLDKRYWDKAIELTGSVRQLEKFGVKKQEIEKVVGVTVENKEIGRLMKALQ